MLFLSDDGIVLISSRFVFLFLIWLLLLVICRLIVVRLVCELMFFSVCSSVVIWFWVGVFGIIISVLERFVIWL